MRKIVSDEKIKGSFQLRGRLGRRCVHTRGNELIFTSGRTFFFFVLFLRETKEAPSRVKDLLRDGAVEVRTGRDPWERRTNAHKLNQSSSWTLASSVLNSSDVFYREVIHLFNQTRASVASAASVAL